MSAQCDSTRWNFPLLPAGPRNLSHHFGATCSPDSATGGCPPPSRCHISGRTPLGNKEAPFPQVLAALFGQVLRKKHALVNDPKQVFLAVPKRDEYGFIFNGLPPILWLNFETNWRSTPPPGGAMSGPIGGYAHPIPPWRKRRGLISGQSVIRNRKIWRRRRDSNPGYAFGAYNGLANRRLQPLGHVSV